MPALSFSFAKKAEPKRVVKELARQDDKEEKRESIVGLEAGHVTIDGPTEAAKAPTIPCKNLLQDPLAKRSSTASDPAAAEKLRAFREQQKQRLLADEQGGLVHRAAGKLSSEDAEAMREILRDAAAAADGGEVPAQAAPILMREESKKAREGKAAPEASREMFDRVPVEGFGEALLRGMGFDPERHKTKPVFNDKPRDNQLGLGAQSLTPSEKAMLAAKRKGGAGAAAAAKAAAAKAAKGAGAAAGGAEAEAAGGAGGASGSGAAAAASAAANGSGEQAEKRRRVDGGSAAEPSPPADEVWASRGLVVRIIGAGADLKDFFGVEGVVLEVDAASGLCKVKARASGKSHVLPGVHLEDLETRVSRDCKEVRVVRGPGKGAVLPLIARDAKRNVARVRREGAETEMRLDDVCQFMVLGAPVQATDQDANASGAPCLEVLCGDDTGKAVVRFTAAQAAGLAADQVICVRNASIQMVKERVRLVAGELVQAGADDAALRTAGEIGEQNLSEIKYELASA